ncbi:hypothetical protein HNY73_011676 [Argiope bruennichi]|uniref:Uncharacterized protein n=1 Tax=Argiope bruennichi TaxID=94029 RepID=A0A8T0EZ08_ARGBR|nr:hypothetical protein HNY73_011676 [Argiope bruennichi]
MTSRRNLLELYGRHRSTLVICPKCSLNEPITLVHFHTNHVYNDHGLAKTDCQFCFGNYKWEDKKLTCKPTVIHQTQCFKSFLKTKKYVPPPEPKPEEEPSPLDQPIPFDLCDDDIFSVCYPCKNFNADSLKFSMFGVKQYPKWKKLGFYDAHPLSKPHWWVDENTIPLSEESGLGTDTAVIFKRFDEFEFYHISLKPLVFPLLEKYLEPIKGHVAVLPYQCLCYGLKSVYNKNNKRPEHQHHRHMILAVRKPYAKQFRKIWTNSIKHPKFKGEKGKLLVHIKDALHLADVIHYLGQRQASCDGKSLNEDSSGSHYWIFRPIYYHGVMGMCTLFSGGLKQFFNFRYRPNKVLPWKDIVQLNDFGKYTVPVWAVQSKIHHCVIPVRRDLQPRSVTDEPTNDYKLWLYETNEIMTFERDPGLLCLSKNEWYANQKNSGNAFFDVVGGSMHVLTPRQQHIMAQIDSVKREMQRKIDGVMGQLMHAKLREVARVDEAEE